MPLAGVTRPFTTANAMVPLPFEDGEDLFRTTWKW